MNLQEIRGRLEGAEIPFNIHGDIRWLLAEVDRLTKALAESEGNAFTYLHNWQAVEAALAEANNAAQCAHEDYKQVSADAKALRATLAQLKQCEQRARNARTREAFEHALADVWEILATLPPAGAK